MENAKKTETPEKLETPKSQVKIEKKLGETDIKVDSKVDSTQLKQEIDQEQLATKEELEKDLASGMKVSEAVGKRSTRLDSMDKWLTVLPFVGDGLT